MKSTGRPLALAVAGAALALVAGVAAVSTSLQASSSGSGQFPVGTHAGMAPGSVPALVFLFGLLLVGIGAAVHDGRELRQVSARPAPRTRPERAERAELVVSRPVSNPVSRPVSRPVPRQTLRRSSRPAPCPATGRRTSTGVHLQLVGSARRS